MSGLGNFFRILAVSGNRVVYNVLIHISVAGLQITGYFVSFINNGSFIKVSTDKVFSFGNTDFNGIVQNIIPYLV